MNAEKLESNTGKTSFLSKKIIGIPEKIGYGMGDFASVMYFKVFSSFLMFFYTDIALIDAAIISTMLWVTRIFDAVNDPVMGMVCDRTNSPHGKFRPWLRWMILPFAISGIAIFTVPEWSEFGKIVYIYVSYTLAMVFYTAINIPYGALMGAMTPHSDERTSLANFRFIGAFTANLLVQWTILYLVVGLGGSDDGSQTQTGYIYTMSIFAAVAVLSFLWTFYATKERITPPKNQTSDFKKDLSQLFKNKPWVAIVFIGVSTIVWIAMRDAAILYYVKYFVVRQIEDSDRFTELATKFNVYGTIATLIGLIFTNFWIKLFRGKRNAYIGLTLLGSVVAFNFYFADQGDLTMIFAIQIVTSFLIGPLMPLFWAMIADTDAYSEWKFGRRFTGLTFSAGTFSQKVGWAVGPAMAGYLLTYYGFVANIEQSPDTIQGLRMMISVIPSTIALGAAALVLTYKINDKLEKQIERELAERKVADGTLEA